ncbi:MAG: type II toxin-antitoxin system VapC family toxin [Mesorhizobium sp.]|nr:type II toxin-antitoxin system VapC family toxin [Mesorhizobium sp.]MBN9244978.1 type II toxin-antitoxin system VapC family toxin [Mesorhizobium sp.]
MFIDASALTAILVGEAGSLELAGRMQRGRPLMTSPIAVWETSAAVARILGLPVSPARQVVFDYLQAAEIELAAIPPEAATLAIEAFDRYGKGRHPAQLNMGDCFAYACSRHFGEPLMFKGGDFPLTDIVPA